MNSFTYNGVNSLDMGLRIESKDVFSSPEYDVQFQAIPGRDGELILPNGRFSNVQVAYSVFLPAKSPAELQQKITRVKQWLFTGANAYHELRDTFDASTFRKAVIKTQLNIEDQLNRIGVFTVSFSCLPFKYLNSGQTSVTITTGGSSSLTNPTPFESKPLIRVNGSGNGNILVANAIGVLQIQIAGISSFMYIDSEQMNCYKGSTSMNSAVTAERYPALATGNNGFMFSGGITSLEVTPRWVTL